ncbi:hypothetical protein B0H14DRAFT_2608867 [Mycena olivaceomarginata]|nr:hypothetical protein B0H14DRAFT_2608867 [Mycena olivaceomarginata]
MVQDWYPHLTSIDQEHIDYPEMGQIRHGTAVKIGQLAAYIYHHLVKSPGTTTNLFLKNEVSSVSEHRPEKATCQIFHPSSLTPSDGFTMQFGLRGVKVSAISAPRIINARLILGYNPWALGRLYLGAVLSKGCFIGLTSVHTFRSHVHGCTDPHCISQHHAYPQLERAAITLMGIWLATQRTEMSQESLEQSLLEWHLKFRENTKICCMSARMNGPSHVEVHQSTFGPNPNLRTNNTLTEKSSSLGFLKDEVEWTQRYPCAPLWHAGTGTNGVANGVELRMSRSGRRKKIIH